MRRHGWLLSSASSLGGGMKEQKSSPAAVGINRSSERLRTRDDDGGISSSTSGGVSSASSLGASRRATWEYGNKVSTDPVTDKRNASGVSKSFLGTSTRVHGFKGSTPIGIRRDDSFVDPSAGAGSSGAHEVGASPASPRTKHFQDSAEVASSPSTRGDGSVMDPLIGGRQRNPTNPGGYYPTTYHGLPPESLELLARAEAEEASGELVRGELDEEQEPGRKTLVAPVMEKMIPGSSSSVSFLGNEGSYLRAIETRAAREGGHLLSASAANQQHTRGMERLLEEGDKTQPLNVKFDRKVRAIATNTGIPLLERSSLLLAIFSDISQNSLSLSSRSYEDIMSTWSIASLEEEQQLLLEFEDRYQTLLAEHNSKKKLLSEKREAFAARERASRGQQDNSGSGGNDDDVDDTDSSAAEDFSKEAEVLNQMAQALEHEKGQLDSMNYLLQGRRNNAAGDAPGIISAGGSSGAPSLPPLVDKMIELYFYVRGNFSAPSPSMMEHMMINLSRVSTEVTTDTVAGGAGSSSRAQLIQQRRVSEIAGRVLMDADTFTALPSTATLAAYIKICGDSHEMPLATEKYVDSLRKLHVTPDAGMAMAMIEGFTKSGMVEEGMRFIGELEKIEMTTPLVNSILNIMLQSHDPTTIFSAFDSSFTELQPTSATYNILLLGCERMNLWEKSVDILSDMQQRKIKGDPTTLNLLIKGMLRTNRHQYAEQIYLSMKSKDLPVWPQLEEAMPKKKRSLGLKLALACQGKSEVQRKQILREIRHGATLELLDGETRKRRTSSGVQRNGVDEKENDVADLRPPTVAFVPSKEEQKWNSAGRSGQHRSKGGTEYYIPRSGNQLKEFASSNRLGEVHPEYLRNFLFAKAVQLRDDMNHIELVKRTHRELFGVWPRRAAPIVPHRNDKQVTSRY